MTREEAIQELCEWLQQMIDHGVPNYSAKREALAYAISALSAEPSVSIQPKTIANSCDLISRADAIEAVYKLLWNEPPYCDSEALCRERAKEIVNALPSADAVSREQYDYVCEEYNRLVHNAVCTKLCDENCEYKKGNTCYHAREHYLIDSVVPSAEPSDDIEGDIDFHIDLKHNRMTVFNNITESPNDVVEKNDEVIERPIIEHDREWIIGCIKHDGFIKTDRFDKANQIILDALADRPSGEWLHRWNDVECSICGEFYREKYNYCPNCGARMENDNV